MDIGFRSFTLEELSPISYFILNKEQEHLIPTPADEFSGRIFSRVIK
jgi:hypothetical protein